MNKSSYCFINKCIPFIAFVVAALFTVILVSLFYNNIDKVSDDVFAHATLSDFPDLVASLHTAQAHGVIIAVHGWEHENYSAISPAEIRKNLARSKAVFDESGFEPYLFVSPYEFTGIPDEEISNETITGMNLVTQLPHIGRLDSHNNEYTWNWRTMNSSSDPQYKAAMEQIKKDQPQIILLHAQDWNKYTDQFLSEYLSTTGDNNITVRMDDVEINTPPSVVNETAHLTEYKSVARVIFAVIPSGIYNGQDPKVKNIKISHIMVSYFTFFVITALFPLLFFVIWKIMADMFRKYIKIDKLITLVDPVYHGLISVVVPAYNEEKAIGKCIESLLAQDYKGQMEIIVVNDGSTDGTPEIIKKYPVELIDLKENAGKANALNQGIDLAKGDIIIFTDSDSFMAKNAISAVIKRFNYDDDIKMVAGNVRINDAGKRGIVTQYQRIEYKLEQELTRHLQSLTGQILVSPGPITAVRKSVLDEVKFSDKTIVEDADFTVNVLKRRMKAVQETNAVVYTNAPETIRAWHKQRKRWWYGNLQVWRAHRAWALTNPWMVLNYSAYIIGVCTIAMFLMLPYLLLQYDNGVYVMLRSLAYIFIPIFLYVGMMSIFFVHSKKSLVMLLPYAVVYVTLKTVLLSYLYICYLSGRGLKIKFGSRTINAK
jgi:cellulose synthase/poly-beta-1,6-N-acetylglucosamine synthase-like glycosyltransferase